MGAARILAVLEPRSNTMKLGTMKAELPGARPTPIRCLLRRQPGGDAAEALAPLGAQARNL